MNYVLYGEERSLIQDALDKIIHDEIDIPNEMNTVVYNAHEVTMQNILDDAQTIPFFADKKIIVVQNANFLSGSNDTEINTDQLEAYLKNPMPSTVLVFIGYFPKLDSRKKIVKFMQKVCRIMAFERLDDYGKQRFINEACDKRNLKLNREAQSELSKRLSADISTINHELNKLSLYGKNIKKEDVEALVTRPLEEDVFQLVNAVVKKDLKSSIHLWNDLCVLNKDAIFLTALLSSQFRFLYQVKILQKQGKSEREITQELKAHPYRVKMSLNSIGLLSGDELLSILNRLADLDQDMKTGKVDKKLGFEMFLIRMQGENK